LWPERESLKLALQHPGVVADYFDGLQAESFSHEAYRAIRDAIEAVGGVASHSEGVDWLSAVTDKVQDLVGKSLVSELAVEDILAPEGKLSAYADSTLSRLQEQQVGNQIAVLKSKLQRMRPSDDERTYNALFADLVALEQSRRELLNRAFRVTPEF
jgi:DNA primase